MSPEHASILLSLTFGVSPTGSAHLRSPFRRAPKRSKYEIDLAWQKMKNRLGSEAEAHREYEEFAIRSYPHVFRRSSRVATKKSRSDFLRDRAVLQQIEKITKGNGVCVPTGKAPRVVANKGKTQRKKRYRSTKDGSISRTLRRRLTRIAKHHIEYVDWYEGRRHYAVHLPNWSHVSPVLAALAYGAAIKYEHRWTFTLKLSEMVIDEALRSPRGFASHIQDRISRYLRKAIRGTRFRMPEFFLIPDVDPERTESLHVHGVIEIAGECDLLANSSLCAPDIPAIKRALGRAGRISDSAPEERARVVDLRHCYGIGGWVSYVTKWYLSVAANLDVLRGRKRYAIPVRKETLVAATQGLRRKGASWYRDALRDEDATLEDTRAANRARIKRKRGLRIRRRTVTGHLGC